MSEAVERKLLTLLGNPTVSPFGNPIPGLEALRGDETLGGETSAVLDALTLLSTTATAEGRPVVIRRISEQLQEDTELLRELADQGVRPGVTMVARLVDGSVTLDGTPLRPGWRSTCSSAPSTRSSPRWRPRRCSERDPLPARAPSPVRGRRPRSTRVGARLAGARSQRRRAPVSPAAPAPSRRRPREPAGEPPRQPVRPAGRLRGAAPARRARAVRPTAPGWPSRCHAGPGEEEVAVGAVGGRPGRAAPGPAADPQRARRVVARSGPRTARCCSPPPGPTRPPRTAGSPSRRCGACPPAAARPGWWLTRPGGHRRGRRRRRHRRRRRRRRRRCPAARTPRPTRSAASERKDAGVTAVLHESYPVRYWDHDLGPAVAAPVLGGAGCRPRSRPTGADAVELRDLTPDAAPPTGAGEDVALSPDGRCLARVRGGARRPGRPAQPRWSSPRPPAASPGCSWTTRWPTSTRPRFSPDGATVVCVRETLSTYAEPPDYTLLLVDVAGGRGSRADPGLRPVAERAAVQRRRLGGLLPGRRRRPARHLPGAGGRRRTGAADRGRRLQRPAASRGTAAPSTRCARPTTPPPCRCAWTPRRRGRSRWRCPTPARSTGCPAPCTRWRRPPPTAPGCSRGWCCPRAPRRTPPRRCCCGSTAVR